MSVCQKEPADVLQVSGWVASWTPPFGHVPGLPKREEAQQNLNWIEVFLVHYLSALLQGTQPHFVVWHLEYYNNCT